MYLDIYFYDYPCWESRVIQRFSGTRLTHVVAGAGDAGFHIDPLVSRWVSLRSLHRIMPYVHKLTIPIKTYPVDLIEKVTTGMDMNLEDLASWYRNRQAGLERPMPDCCVTAVRRMLLVCGVSIDQGTPDEIYEQLQPSSVSLDP
jgi:hypothetical protein